MSRILLACSTVDGHTLAICRRIEARLAAVGHTVALCRTDDAATRELAAHDVVVVGASIRYGRHRPDVLALADTHLAQLPPGVRSAFFSVNIVARKPGKDAAETNPYVRQFLQRVRWKPTLVDVFAGKLDYPRYHAFDRLMIRIIMLVTHGPTDPTAVVEFTDWARVDGFADRVSAL